MVELDATIKAYLEDGIVTFYVCAVDGRGKKVVPLIRFDGYADGDAHIIEAYRSVETPEQFYNELKKVADTYE